MVTDKRDMIQRERWECILYHLKKMKCMKETTAAKSENESLIKKSPPVHHSQDTSFSKESWDETLYGELSHLSMKPGSSSSFIPDAKRVHHQLLGPSLSSMEIDRDKIILLESFLAIDIQRQCLKAAFKSLERIAARYTSRIELELLEQVFFKPNPEGLSLSINGAHQQMKREFEKKNSSGCLSTASLLGIHKDVLKVIWRIARSLVDEKEYEYAYQILFLLLALEPLIIEAWLTYGYVNHQMRSFNTAINAYLTARQLAADEIPAHLLFIADCFADMDSIDDAEFYMREFFKKIEGEKAIVYQESPLFSQLMGLAYAVLEKLNTKHNERKKRARGE